MKDVNWVAVKELKLSYHNGYMRCMYIYIYIKYVGYIGFRA